MRDRASKGQLSHDGGRTAALDDLEYLPAGDAALTRRAAKYSGRTAVVVRFSRSRGRYERQGILVEETALKKAELECTEEPRNGRQLGLAPPSGMASRIAIWSRA